MPNVRSSFESMREPSHLEAFEFLSQAPGLNDAAELEQHFAKALGAFGFDRYACARLDTSGGGARPLILASQGVGDWDQYMADQGYNAVNPCKHWRDAGRDAFTWREVRQWSRRTLEPNAKADELWEDAASNGMKDGLTITSPGPSGEVLITRIMTEQPSIRPGDRHVLESLAIVFATLRLRLHEQAGDRPLNGVLTMREAECLRWASRGLTDHAIAERIGVSAKTVNFHVENARRKLGAPNRLAAYHRALELNALA